MKRQKDKQISTRHYTEQQTEPLLSFISVPFSKTTIIYILLVANHFLSYPSPSPPLNKKKYDYPVLIKESLWILNIKTF
jgi:hypothetical protein